MRALSKGLLTGNWAWAARVTPPAAVVIGQTAPAGAPLGALAVPGPLHLVDIADRLGMSVAELDAVLCVTPGQVVAQGEVLARQRGWRRRQTVVAPCAGTVQGVAEGCLLLRETALARTVAAPLAGQVAAISADGEVTLQLSGTRIACAWASGSQAQGPLVLATALGDELAWQHVGRQLAGAVLVGGRLADERALHRARQFGLAGLVVGGVSLGLSRRCPANLPVLATEGLGDLAMSAPVHAALARLAGHTAFLSAGEAVHAPWVGIAHDAASCAAKAPPSELAVGVRVRLMRAPYLGQSGEIVDLPAVARRTALGTLCEGALVALTSGERVFAPWANLERLS